MTATNHALTGALIGLTATQPLFALPLAFFSHFVCDAIPHYGSSDRSVNSRRFKRILALDMLLCVTLVAFLAYAQPSNWLLASICAFVATSADLMWVKKFINDQKADVKLSETKQNWVLRFHARIQWFERPIGGLVEMVWAIAAAILLKVYLI